MSNHVGGYMLCEVLTLLKQAGVWEALPRATTQHVVREIVKLACDGYDCNAGELLEGHDDQAPDQPTVEALLAAGRVEG